MDPADASPDLVGRTSARLLADGVERADRLDALRLLAVLDASTDADGRVRRPLDDLAAEFDLPPMGVLRSLDHLERAGAIRRDGPNVLLLDRDEGVGGLRLADFLDDVRSSFDDELDLVEHDRSTWLVRSGAALAAVAALIAVLTLVPTQPSVQPVATAPTTASAQSSSTSSSASSAADEPTATSSSSIGRTPFGTAPVTEPVPGVVDTTVVAATDCPTGSPTTEIVGNVIHIVNPTAADIVVTRLDVGGVLSATVITIPAGQTVDHPLPAAPPSASIAEWQWADPGTASTCRS